MPELPDVPTLKDKAPMSMRPVDRRVRPGTAARYRQEARERVHSYRAFADVIARLKPLGVQAVGNFERGVFEDPGSGHHPLGRSRQGGNIKIQQ